MSSIIDKIQSFFNWVQSTYDSFTHLLSSVGSLIRIVLNYARYILSIFPAWLYGLLLGILVVSALYVILGRSSSS